MNPNLRYIGNEANFLKNIGFRIQFFRKKSGLSQEELAEKSGLSYSTISHIESSTPYPMSMVAIYRIANALDVAPYQLLKFDWDRIFKLWSSQISVLRYCNVDTLFLGGLISTYSPRVARILGHGLSVSAPPSTSAVKALWCQMVESKVNVTARWRFSFMTALRLPWCQNYHKRLCVFAVRGCWCNFVWYWEQ